MARTKASRIKRDLSGLCEQILRHHLRETDESRMVIHVPQLRDHVMERPGLHFHFNPDLIIGLGGASCFEFIQESFIVPADSLAIIPGLLQPCLQAGRAQDAARLPTLHRAFHG